ncbi:hypothetical protein HY992_03975 [Candidatus Micrarchaeota archaeon]|nr:hypothetical protein [Candidatus Micrarchaeota archaeon]
MFDRIAREGRAEEYCGEVAGKVVAISVADCVEVVDEGNGGRVMGWVAAATTTAVRVLETPKAQKPKRKKPVAGGKPKAEETPRAAVIAVAPMEQQTTTGRTSIGMEGMVIEVPKPQTQQEAPKEEETAKVVADAKKNLAKSKKEFVVVDRMAKEYSKGNYDAVLVLDAAAKKDMNAAYALATNDRLMVITAMMMQQRRQPQDTLFGGFTFAFTRIGVSTGDGKRAVGEPVKEEGEKAKEEQAKASAEAQAYAADAALVQVIIELPAIAEAQGLKTTTTTGPFTQVGITLVETRSGETTTSQLPDYGSAARTRQSKGTRPPVLATDLAPDFTGVLAQAPAAREKKEPPKFGGVAKAKPKEEGGVGTAARAKRGEESGTAVAAVTLSREEQQVYAAAVERLKELVEEGTRKTAGKKVEERKPKAA